MTDEGKLQRYADNLSRLRDEELESLSKYEYGQEYYRGRASAFRLALSLLHTWSEGAVGTSLEDQPNPRTVRPGPG